MTRAIHHLTNGRIFQAEWYNLMLIPAILILAYSGYRYVRFLIKDEEIINRRMELILKTFLVVIIVFGITRNFTDLFY